MPEVLPELGALAAAGLLLLIAAALWVLQGLLTNTLGRLPVVGSWVSTNLNSALNDARNAVLSGASASWGAAKQLFRWMEAFARNPIEQTVLAFFQVYSFGRRLIDVTLPDLQARILITTSGWVSSAESFASGLYNSAVNYANGLEARALVTVSGWVSSAESRAVSLFDSVTASLAADVVRVESDAASLVTNASTALKADILAAENVAAADLNALQQSVQSAVNTLAGDIVSGVDRAEAFAASEAAALVGGVYTDLDTWARQGLADAWPDVQGDIGALRGVLGADFPWLNELLGALGGLGVAGLAGALIQSAATSQALTRLAADCVVPNCRNLSGLGNDLSNLLSTASTAAMLAWLIFAVTDPGGWSSEMVSAAAPVASGLANDAARLFRGG